MKIRFIFTVIIKLKQLLSDFLEINFSKATIYKFLKASFSIAMSASLFGHSCLFVLFNSI